MIEYSLKPKTLASIVPHMHLLDVSDQLLVSDIHTDSREVAPGDLFIALEGLNSNGEHYISHAVENGAAAVLVEHGHLSSVINVEVPIIGVENLKHKVADICINFFGDASTSMSIIGVTGTNGKSTITSLIAQLGESYGHKSGILGTLGYGLVNDPVVETGMTTPDLIRCHRILAQLSREKAKLVAMEVSSHGIDQDRIANIAFDVGVISNITRDHLDYHGTFESYANTKKSFLLADSCATAVVNIDDPECASLVESLKQSGKEFLTYSVGDTNADISAEINTYSKQSTEISIRFRGSSVATSFPLVGKFNLSNLLAALAALLLRGYQFNDLVNLVPQLRPVSGRLERVGMAGDENLPQVFVDFAHTADALAQVLGALKKHVKGKLWLVFGCGGDRDRGKRPEMGRIAASLADRIIITSDNPRTESPASIIDEIVSGLGADAIFETVEDRRVAIFLAIGSCAADDTVLIAGKGHENYQLIGKQKLPFQDNRVAKEALKERLSACGGKV